MKSLPTQQRARLKRAALIDAAVNEFSSVGFELATAKSIAASAGVATGTFYQYFDNKNEILRIIAIDRYQQLQQHFEWFDSAKNRISGQYIEATIRRILQSVYDFHALNPELHQVLEQRKTSDESLAQIMHEGEFVLRSRALLFVQSFNMNFPEIVANNLFAMGEGIVHHHVFEHTGLDQNDVLDVGAKMLASYFLTLK